MLVFELEVNEMVKNIWFEIELVHVDMEEK